MFIAFEGGEGTGKSTQMRLIAEWLRSKGTNCIETREPGGSPLAERIRFLFKEVPSHGDIPTPLTELMLVMASRSQHIERTIRPHLLKNEWVLCDRFLDSTYVYQGILGKLEKKSIDTAANLVLGGLIPDLTLIFTVPIDMAIQRMGLRKTATRDRLDEFDEAVHRKIDRGFQSLVEDAVAYPNGKIPVRILVDSRGSIEQVQEDVRRALMPSLGIS